MPALAQCFDLKSSVGPPSWFVNLVFKLPFYKSATVDPIIRSAHHIFNMADVPRERSTKEVVSSVLDDFERLTR